MLVIQNPSLLDLMRHRYRLEDIHRLSDVLSAKNTLTFRPLATGLFPAAVTTDATQYTGYKQVWVRDNIFVAYAHYRGGEPDIACRTLRALLDYFGRHRRRFEHIIETPKLADNPMERPHIRFDGETLQEIDEKWAHNQNDALGYFLWLYCKLLGEGSLTATQADVEVLALFPLYFSAIAYWIDEDSGHWEEARKQEASSIGAVIAGLEALRQAIFHHPGLSSAFAASPTPVTLSLLDDLIQQGTQALHGILPYECRHPSARARRYDAALLFLVYPLEVVSGTMADQIIHDVIDALQGDRGIKRYRRDSFWAADYKKKLSPEQRTINVSDDMSFRNTLIEEGQEAQWCIFDPIVSVIFGRKFQSTRNADDLRQQTAYLNRSLGQLTSEDCSAGGFKCPELYYLEDGTYVANDATPLLWTQANLMMALQQMEESLR